jgi:hypothetical protein
MIHRLVVLTRTRDRRYLFRRVIDVSKRLISKYDFKNDQYLIFIS